MTPIFRHEPKDQVVIVANYAMHEFPQGRIVTVTDEELDHWKGSVYGYYCKGIDKRGADEIWLVDPRDIIPLSVAMKKGSPLRDMVRDQLKELKKQEQ